MNGSTAAFVLFFAVITGGWVWWMADNGHFWFGAIVGVLCFAALIHMLRVTKR